MAVPATLLMHDSCIISISANLVLHRTIERIHVGKKYGDIPRGIFVIRGENVVLLGEVVSDVCHKCHCILSCEMSNNEIHFHFPSLFNTQVQQCKTQPLIRQLHSLNIMLQSCCQ